MCFPFTTSLYIWPLLQHKEKLAYHVHSSKDQELGWTLKQGEMEEKSCVPLVKWEGIFSKLGLDLKYKVDMLESTSNKSNALVVL